MSAILSLISNPQEVSSPAKRRADRLANCPAKHRTDRPTIVRNNNGITESPADCPAKRPAFSAAVGPTKKASYRVDEYTDETIKLISACLRVSQATLLRTAVSMLERKYRKSL